MNERNDEWKHLLLWRHAEAEDENDRGNLARGLTARGKVQAQAVAAWLLTQQRHGGVPQDLQIFASPAERAQQTVAALRQPFTTDPCLAPGALPEDYLRLAGWNQGPEDFSSVECWEEASWLEERREAYAVLIVGHQPTLGQTAARLLAQQKAVWNIRKGALWWFAQRQRAGTPQNVLLAAIDPRTAAASMR
ncbi:MAG: histidine phosphatase family protein [Betaproteobacteria bacterium]|nr:histidine phosphatase family protein [Betaproteobacteria bacterium]